MQTISKIRWPKKDSTYICVYSYRLEYLDNANKLSPYLFTDEASTFGDKVA